VGACDLKIVVLVRTKNEAKRIGLFCQSYKDADHIIVSDGGSEDGTVAIASEFPNVVLRPYSGRVQLQNGMWRNNDALHVNHLIEAAKEFQPEFVILDDCDCRPTRELKENYRHILTETDKDFVHVVRFYFWGTEQYFPLMSMPGRDNVLEPSLWAWRGRMDFKMIDVPPAYDFMLDGAKAPNIRVSHANLDLYPPLALLHYSWDEERIEQKLKDYRESGFIPGYNDPRTFAGQMLPKTDWMIE
jgi:glycosyltransferase involved in cell wall biosynthesis